MGRVYNYVNKELEVDLDLHFAQAQRAVNEAKAAHDRLEQIDRELQTEITKAEQRLRQCHTRLHESLAAVVTAAPEFATLMDAHTQAWRRLRSVRAALAHIQSACHGNLPQSIESKIIAVEPLEERVHYPLDPEPLASWSSALQRLEHDHEAELPTEV